MGVGLGAGRLVASRQVSLWIGEVKAPFGGWAVGGWVGCGWVGESGLMDWWVILGYIGGWAVMG